MENNTSPAKSSIIYGVLFAVIMILEFVIGYVMNIDPQSNKSYGLIINLLNFLVLPIVFIYLACQNYKVNLNSGFIAFSQCLKIGVSLCVIGGLLYSMFSSTFAMIFPEYFDEMFRKARILMLENNPQLTAEQADLAMSFSKKFLNPAIAIPSTVVIFSFIGLIYSLIVGAFVKKDPNQSF